MGELPDQPFMRPAANLSKEPSLPNFCDAAKVCYHGGDKTA